MNSFIFPKPKGELYFIFLFDSLTLIVFVLICEEILSFLLKYNFLTSKILFFLKLNFFFLNEVLVIFLIILLFMLFEILLLVLHDL